MFNPAVARKPRPPNAQIRGVLLAVILTFALAHSASAYVDKPVRWARSPLKDTLGQPLPPAVNYEVWLLPSGSAEYLAATVSDTTYTLRAMAGITYYLRVRGVSATGLKSAFSQYSNAYRSTEVADAPPELQAAFGPVYPNPFNAQTTIAYQVPVGLAGTARVSLEIFDVRGRRRRTFALDRDPGAHQVRWDGRDNEGATVPAGMYVARFVCGSYSSSTKLTLIP